MKRRMLLQSKDGKLESVFGPDVQNLHKVAKAGAT